MVTHNAFTNTGLDLCRRRVSKRLLLTRMRTARVLHERFARVVSADTCLAGLASVV